MVSSENCGSVAKVNVCERGAGLAVLRSPPSSLLLPHLFLLALLPYKRCSNVGQSVQPCEAARPIAFPSAVAHVCKKHNLTLQRWSVGSWYSCETVTPTPTPPPPSLIVLQCVYMQYN